MEVGWREWPAALGRPSCEHSETVQDGTMLTSEHVQCLSECRSENKLHRNWNTAIIVVSAADSITSLCCWQHHYQLHKHFSRYQTVLQEGNLLGSEAALLGAQCLRNSSWTVWSWMWRHYDPSERWKPFGHRVSHPRRLVSAATVVTLLQNCKHQFHDITQYSEYDHSVYLWIKSISNGLFSSFLFSMSMGLARCINPLPGGPDYFWSRFSSSSPW